MTVIIGDIHGDLPQARAFLNYKPEVEHVALGDFVDSRDPKTTFEDELACLDLLLDSAAILVWGNHDLAYTLERPWDAFTCFCHAGIFESRYQSARLRGRFTPVHATADGWLCSHAGISAALAGALPDCPWDSSDPASIAAWLTEEFEREMAAPRLHGSANTEGRYGEGPLFTIGRMRGGHDRYGGLFWYDEQWEPGNPPDPRLKQIFGHSCVAGPSKAGKGPHINIHIEDGWWVYDTEADEFIWLKRNRNGA